MPVAGAHGPAVVYPNSGQGWNAATRSWEGRSAFDPADVAAWVAAGARLVGGCCRVGTGDITALRATASRRASRTHGHSLVSTTSRCVARVIAT